MEGWVSSPARQWTRGDGSRAPGAAVSVVTDHPALHRPPDTTVLRARHCFDKSSPGRAFPTPHARVNNTAAATFTRRQRRSGSGGLAAAS